MSRPEQRAHSLYNPDSAEAREGWLKLQNARTFVKHKFPYFYNVVLGFIPHHVPGFGSMFVTKKMILGVDMEWYGTVSVEVAGGCLMHEAMHILRDITRVHAFPNKDVAGVAFDMPINDDLRACGAELPDWVIYPETYKLPQGLTGEKYYELLMSMNLAGAISKLKGKIGSGGCGSCNAEGNDSEGEGGEIEKQVEGTEGRSSSDVAYFRSLGLRDIRDHAEKGGFGRGKIPGSIRELLALDGSEEVVVPWQQVASSSLGRSLGRIKYGHSDYSLRRPSKRSYALGFPRPGLITLEPTICFIEDTSGSMGIREQIRANRAEMAQLMIQLGIQDAWFIQADTSVRGEPQLVTVTDLATLPAVGRGGTSFIHAIETALNLIPKPDLIIYSTDGDGDAPANPPYGVEFIWLLAPGEWTRSPCNWGTQILTTNDRALRKKYKIQQYG